VSPGLAEGLAEADSGGGDIFPFGRQVERVDAVGKLGRRDERAEARGGEEFKFFELFGEGGDIRAVIPMDDAFRGVAATDEKDAGAARSGAGFAGDVEEEAAVRDGGGEAGARRAEAAQPGGALVERSAFVELVGHGAGEDEDDLGGMG